MDKRDVAELKKRFKKDACTITRMAGCYVDINRNKIVKLNETFLNLPEEEFYKYLELARKTMSGTVGNNILEVDFAAGQEGENKQQFLLGLRESKLKNEELLDRLYDIIIEGYQNLSNYLILVFHDCYDIMTRTSDNQKIDESEEVFEYLLVSVCPVELSKAGLGYNQEDNRIGARIRDYVVGAPSLRFLFPAFSNGEADVNKIDYFVKDPKNSQSDFVENVLGCTAKRTGTEKRKVFAEIVKQAFCEDKEKAEETLTEIQESFQIRCDAADVEEILSAPIILDKNVLAEILSENEIPEEPAKIITEICDEEFCDEKPEISVLYDAKALEKSLEEKKKQELVKEVAQLKSEINAPAQPTEIVLKLSEEKADMIKADFIDGQRYVMIPVDDNDEVKVNGQITEL